LRKILFIIPYPLFEAPSQRFRFEQYLPLLREKGFEYEIESFLISEDWRSIYAPGHYLKKFKLITMGWLRRIQLLFSLRDVAFVFIHREAAPFGPPVLEWIMAKLLKKKIIYDFDDAIWATDKQREPWAERLIRWRSKIGSVISWSHRVSCGNEYLCNYARNFTTDDKVVLNPTVIDTDTAYNPELFSVNKDPRRVTIGWTGSRSTLKYARSLMPVLQQLVAEFPQVDVLIIADQDDGLNTERFYFRKWSSATETSDLLQMDIGIMPLPDDPWAKGKCGLKALQYMALRIPSVISPVGVNTVIIENGVNGFLCGTDEEWKKVLSRLIEDAVLRKKIGQTSRETVVTSYSVNANSDVFLSLFQE
jgi:glycosyltransferase involved in cell wall biosynthesis